MASLLKWAKTAVRRAPSPPLRFASTGFNLISDAQTFEEEQFDGFEKGLYYPVNIGDIFVSKYQVLGKLDMVYHLPFGWLVISKHEHVTLKIIIRDGDPLEEFRIYQQLSKGNYSHPGYSHIRTALETFAIPRSGGEYTCLIQKPIWESFRDLRHRIPNSLFMEVLFKGALKQFFLVLDYLYTECKLVHTDISKPTIYFPR
ncbi:hypothetical protein EAE96_009211 [Botrytis aclada]|nr:hypothetical protein EAE96_009211 [Botrytis aclada]